MPCYILSQPTTGFKSWIKMDKVFNFAFGKKYPHVARLDTKRRIVFGHEVNVREDFIIPLSNWLSRQVFDEPLKLLTKHAHGKFAPPVTVKTKRLTTKYWSNLEDENNPVEGWVPFKSIKLCDFISPEGEAISQKFWGTTINVKKKLEAWKSIRVFAYDYESLSIEGEYHQPYMVAVVEKLPEKEEPVTVQVYEGDLLTEMFLSWIFEGLQASPRAVWLFYSYNGVGYDHAHILRCYYHSRISKRFPLIKISYAKADNRLLVVEFKHKKTKSMAKFRDVLQYLPAGTRGSLAKVCESLKLPYTKRLDITLEELNKVGEAILKQPGRQWRFSVRLTYERVKDYCIRDCKPLFWIAAYVGRIFDAIPRVHSEIFTKNRIIPDEFQRLYIFCLFGYTLANIAFVFIPYSQDEYFQTRLGNDCLIISSHEEAAKARRSIVGGKCLSGFVGHVLRPNLPGSTGNMMAGERIDSVDVSSMYPSASVGPLPGGMARYMTCAEIEAINTALANFTFDPMNYPPFIAYVRMYKARVGKNHTRTKWGRECHVVTQVFPCIPYRSHCSAAMDMPTKRKVGPLEWIDDTDGKTMFNFYTSMTIYTAMQAGFIICIDPLGIKVEQKMRGLDGEWHEECCICLEKYPLKLKCTYYCGHSICARCQAQIGDKCPLCRDMRGCKSGASAFGADYKPKRLWPLVWDHWSHTLGEMFQEIYSKKTAAKFAGDATLELAMKIFLNATIGKFAMRPTEVVDPLCPIKTGQAKDENTSMYQLNAFIMANKDRISMSLLAFAVCGDQRAIKALWNSNTIYERLPIYGDTDSLCYITTEEGPEIEEAIEKCGLKIDGQVGDWEPEHKLVRFRLEPETWHKCPVRNDIRNHKLFFSLARKIYILICAYCNQARTKCKGHQVCKDEDDEEAIGFRIRPFLNAFLYPQGHINENIIFDNTEGDYCSSCLNQALFKLIMPTFGDDEADCYLTSGKRNTFKKEFTTADAYPFLVKNGSIERTVQLVIAGGDEPFQKICYRCKCSIHI